MRKVLEVNVDDLYTGGVYSLVKNVIQSNTNQQVKIDIAAIEHFQSQSNIDLLNRYHCDVYYVGSKGSKWKKQIDVYRNLKSLIQEKQYDCIHIHADTANKLLVSGLAAKATGVRTIILHSHSAGIDGNHRKIKGLIHRICRIMLPYAGNVFVACSDYAAAWMFPRMNQKKIRIINNGIDLQKFEFNETIRAKNRDELGLMDDELLIGHVGRFLFQKNHEYLLEIMQEIREKNIKARLLLVGEGERYEEIHNLAESKELLSSIFFYGPSNKVNELMMAMDVFLLPSHFEGLPIVGVEAQASGLPVIFSNKITREADLTGNVTYLPVGKDDIDKWINSISRVFDKRIDRKGIHKVLTEKQFDISDTVKAFLKLYQER